MSSKFFAFILINTVKSKQRVIRNSEVKIMNTHKYLSLLMCVGFSLLSVFNNHLLTFPLVINNHTFSTKIDL